MAAALQRSDRPRWALLPLSTKNAILVIVLSLCFYDVNLMGSFFSSFLDNTYRSTSVRAPSSAFPSPRRVTADQCAGIPTSDDACPCLSDWFYRGMPKKGGIFHSAIWNHFENEIRQGALASMQQCHGPNSKHLDLAKFDEFLKLLFASLDTFRLKQSTKTRAHPRVMRQIRDVILNRLADPTKYPPLKIAVFGGSVTAGSNGRMNEFNLPCRRRPIEVWTECAWPNALHQLLNHVFGRNDTVVVKNYAIGGYTSVSGVATMDYMWPDGEYVGQDFDIIVSAYATNDGMQPISRRDSMYSATQTFVRKAMDQRPCSDLPLVIVVEDNMMETLGEVRDKDMDVRDTFKFSRDMAETANWAGVMSVSYADAIRTFVYKDTSSHLMTHISQTHPGHSFHTGIAWAMAWNLLTGIIDSCDAVPEPPLVPLPMLHAGLTSSEIEPLWQEQTRERKQLCAGEQPARPTCLYKWLAVTSTTEEMAQAMSTVLTNNTGWIANGEKGKKRFWLGQGLSSSFTIQMDEITVPIDRLWLLYIKSYGKAWESSRVLLVIEGKRHADAVWTELRRSELKGIHDSHFSLPYSHDVDLGDSLRQGSSIRATFTIIGGSRFQIIGMALCHFRNNATAS